MSWPLKARQISANGRPYKIAKASVIRSPSGCSVGSCNMQKSRQECHQYKRRRTICVNPCRCPRSEEQIDPRRFKGIFCQHLELYAAWSRPVKTGSLLPVRALQEPHSSPSEVLSIIQIHDRKIPVQCCHPHRRDGKSQMIMYPFLNDVPFAGSGRNLALE